jgi:hypothetical protein
MTRGKRKDLGCPFGCSEAHRKEQSNRRSAAYYRSKEGRRKKRDLNQRRPAACRSPALASRNTKGAPTPAQSGPWPAPLVEHVRMVVSWIERRNVHGEEILEMLAKVLRQQGMGRRRRIDHTVAWLNEHPP